MFSCFFKNFTLSTWHKVLTWHVGSCNKDRSEAMQVCTTDNQVIKGDMESRTHFITNNWYHSNNLKYIILHIIYEMGHCMDGNVEFLFYFHEWWFFMNRRKGCFYFKFPLCIRYVKCTLQSWVGAICTMKYISNMVVVKVTWLVLHTRTEGQSMLGVIAWFGQTQKFYFDEILYWKEIKCDNNIDKITK